LLNGTNQWYRKDSRVTKNDILEYVKNRVSQVAALQNCRYSIAEPVPVAKAPTTQKVALYQ
jgi:hypothetical protein